MATIKPTIGRVVLFFHAKHSPEPRAAIICHVHSDTLVNLATFNAHGENVPATSVPLVQEGEEIPTGARCEWMPYQLGQAAKTEALERQVGQVGAGG